MKKNSLKKIILSGLMALQLSNGFSGNTLSQVSAIESIEDLLFMNKNGQSLKLIGMILNGYERITVGYVYKKDQSIYVEDARNGRIYNLTNISNYYESPKILFTDVKNVLPTELKDTKYLTKEEADEIVTQFQIANTVTQLPDANNIYWDYTYQTFSSTNSKAEVLPITTCSLFKDTENLFDSFTENDFKLGLKEMKGTYPIYQDIYQEDPIGEANGIGMITGYYVLNNEGKRIATLKTQNEIDEFIANNENLLNEYTFKASFYKGTSIDEILDAIENNRRISYENTSYFIDYKPVQKTLSDK